MVKIVRQERRWKAPGEMPAGSKDVSREEKRLTSNAERPIPNSLATRVHWLTTLEGTLILAFSHGEKGRLHAFGAVLVGRDSVEPNECALQSARLDRVSPYQETRDFGLPLPEGEYLFSAKGAVSCQPGATPQEHCPQRAQALKARLNASTRPRSWMNNARE